MSDYFVMIVILKRCISMAWLGGRSYLTFRLASDFYFAKALEI